MSFPRWRQSLARSLHKHRSKHESKYFQVATVDKNGKPRNRTMVHRGFWRDSNQIIAISDMRSAKFEDFLCLPEAELCWYFPQTREQYRIAVQVNVYGQSQKNDDSREAKEILQKVWCTLSDGAKGQFYWPAPKSEMAQNDGNKTKTVEQKIPSNMLSSKELPKHFAVLIFTPIEVDYLQLKTDPQTRLLYSLQSTLIQKDNHHLDVKNSKGALNNKNEEWYEKRVNP